MPLRDRLDFSAFFSAGRLAFTPEVTDLVAVTCCRWRRGRLSPRSSTQQAWRCCTRRWALRPAAAGVVSGQHTSLTLLLVVLTVWALVRGHDGGAGVATELLAYGSPLAAPLLGLLLRGRWGALGAAGGVFALHWLAWVIATGGQLDWPVAWLETVGAHQEVDLLANGQQAISLPAFGRQLEILTGLPGLMAAGGGAGRAVRLAGGRPLPLARLAQPRTS